MTKKMNPKLTPKNDPKNDQKNLQKNHLAIFSKNNLNYDSENDSKLCQKLLKNDPKN